MKHNPFESQLERIARTLTDQYGVQVICQGDEAYTDGKRIVLPSLPEPMSDPLERMVVGFLDHEMSHVAFSDFNVVKEFAEKHRQHFGMLNAIEDALIEQRAMKRWPGVRANLDAMFQQIRDRVQAKLGQADPFHRFSCAVYFKLSHHTNMLGTEGEIIGYEDLLAEFPNVRNTRDAAALSERILERWLASQASTQGAEAQQQNSNDQSAPSPDEKTASSQGTETIAAEEDASSGNVAGDPQSGEHANKDGENTSRSSDSEPAAATAENQSGSGKSIASGNGAGGPGGSLVSQALGEAIVEQAAQVDSSEAYRVFTKAHDAIELECTAPDRDVRELLGRDGDTIRRLRRGLINALRSAEKRWWREDENRGVLSPRTLHRLCLDRPRLDVFRQRSTVQGRSTAVCMVLDASGSMTVRKMTVARSAVRVLLEALAYLNVETEVFTFTTGIEYDLNRASSESGLDMTDLRQRFGRVSNLRIRVIKNFTESTKAALGRLPSVRGTGLTPLGEAMQVGARRIIVRPESRKIMLVLTDGKAGCEGTGCSAHNHACQVAGQISRTGIELIGVGIQNHTVTDVIDDAIVVHEIQDLPGRLCKLLASTLKKGLRHVG